jgi:hypothetical protein
LEIQCLSAIAANRIYILRGLPQGVVRDSTDYNPVPSGIGTRINAWCRLLRTGSDGLAACIYQRVLGWFTIQPTSVAISGGGKGLTLTYPNGLAPATPFPGAPPNPNLFPRVLMFGISGANACNGIWRVASNDTTKIILQPRQTLIFGTPNPPTRSALITYTAQPITSAIPVRGMSRKTGSPSVKLRGRARARGKT